MKLGALIVGEILERLDLVQDRVRTAPVPQVFQVAPGGLFLAGGQRIEEGGEILVHLGPRGLGHFVSRPEGPGPGAKPRVCRCEVALDMAHLSAVRSPVRR
jgi:hypothetical protein